MTVARAEASSAVAAIVAGPDWDAEHLAHFDFVGASLSPHDVLLGDSIGAARGGGQGFVTAAADLDGDGIDEVIVAGQAQGASSVSVFELDDATLRWARVQTAPVELALGRAALMADAPAGAGPGTVIGVGDVDGDGDDDVLVTTNTRLPRVLVFENDDGALGPEPTVLVSPNNPGFEFAHIEPWHLDAHGARRWLVAGDDGVGVADIDLDARQIILDDIDQRDGSYRALTTGDINRDGLLDLIVATRNEVRVHFAVEQVGRGEG